MADLDQFERIPIPIASDLAMQLGFDRSVGVFAGSEARFIGVAWMPGANDPELSDGYVSASGNDRGFLKWDKEAGEKLLTRAAEEYDEFSTDDVPDHTVRLSTVYADDGMDIGSEIEQGNAMFLLDTRKQELYIGDYDEVKSFLTDANPQPEDLSLVEAAKELHEEMNEAADDLTNRTSPDTDEDEDE